MNKAALFGAIFTLFVFGSGGLSHADDQKWTGTLERDFVDCNNESVDRIIISGAVLLVHPQDKDLSKDAKKISIFCPGLIFEEGSSLSTISFLDIRISDTTSGPVKILNTRGVRGSDGSNPPYSGADPNADIWALRKMPKAPDGGGAGNGDNARGCVLIDDQDSSPGGRGGNGIAGQTGANQPATGGEPGKNGTSAGDVVLISRKFAEGTTIDISASGGSGGAGGLGGRGTDGGEGGDGGHGGKGGNSSKCHLASRGGDGGTGGNGGDGGNGGAGGDGGNAGNGGRVTVLKEDGGPAPAPVIANFGGTGGEPGLGGEQGRGGKGGQGGAFGYGGDSSGGVFGKIDRKGEGGQGNNGEWGKVGMDGQPGPIGQRGKDGQNGEIGRGLTGSITGDQIKDLLLLNQ